MRGCRAFWIAILLPTGSCGVSVSTPESNWIGTWRLSSQSCDGPPIVTTGLARSTMTLSETRGNQVLEYSNGCTVRLEDFLVTPVGNGQVEIAAITAESVSCTPNPCIGETVATVGGESFTTRLTCPDDFPPLITGQLSPARVEGNFLVADLTRGDGTICTTRYARESR